MQTIRYTDKKGNNARVTDHPEWSASQPWASYINGTAGRHFACPEDADAHLKEKGCSRAADTTTGKEK